MDKFCTNDLTRTTRISSGTEYSSCARKIPTPYMQHHLVNYLVQHLLAHFYLARRPRPNPALAPAPSGGSRSTGSVARLCRVFRCRFSKGTHSANRPGSINQTAVYSSGAARVYLQGGVVFYTRYI